MTTTMQEAKKRLFGTDGIRGIPGKPPLEDETLVCVGRALGAYLRATSANPRVLIGMDTRESGPHIAGVEPVSAGIVTTPGVAWLVRRDKFSAGVVISASHNPYHDNGVKLISSDGMKFPDTTEAEIERMMEELPAAWRLRNVTPPEDTRLHEEYLGALRACALPGAKFRGMKVVLDCANGAASHLAPDLFASLGCRVDAIHHTPDGRNINAGCGSLHTEGLRKRVVETGASLGVAFDGDADRALFCTASGKLVDGDGILFAMARYMKAQGTLKGPAVVGTSMANLGLDKALSRNGLRLTRVDVGDRYVLEEMQRTGANLGGEQSGHILFLDDATTGDGMLTAIKMASLVSIGGPLEALVADLKIFPQRLENVRVSSKPALNSLADVSRLLAEAERTLGSSGRVVLRYSGTEPLVRVMVEAEREEDVRHWTETLAAALRKAIGAEEVPGRGSGNASSRR
jgi:phosphoglucosamine mutase